MQFVAIQEHELAHISAALALGVRVEEVRVDPRWPLDGVTGLHGQVNLDLRPLAHLDALERDKVVAVIAYMPRLLSVGDPWSSHDDEQIERLRPADHDALLWRWTIGHRARRLFVTDAISRSYADALERIEADGVKDGGWILSGRNADVLTSPGRPARLDQRILPGESARAAASGSDASPSRHPTPLDYLVSAKKTPLAFPNEFGVT